MAVSSLKVMDDPDLDEIRSFLRAADDGKGGEDVASLAEALRATGTGSRAKFKSGDKVGGDWGRRGRRWRLSKG